MNMNRFLSFFLFAFLFHGFSYAQFDLVKDFDGSAQWSFGYSNGAGPLYSMGTNMLVQYDSIVDEQHESIAALAAVDADGNSQLLAASTVFPHFDGVPFFDFKTLTDGRVAFAAIASATSYKVIITNGTTAGTTVAYSTTAPIYGLELIDNGLYFTLDGNNEQALMKIDLTSLAVSEVAAFGSLHTISDVSKVSNTSLIFMAADATDNDVLKLYVSDGTEDGTTALAVINSGDEVFDIALLSQVGTKVYFFSKLPDVACCSALWVTDGTVAGTQKLTEVQILSAVHLLDQEMTFGWNGAFYFAAVEKDAATEHVLWKSDGTVAGTIQLMTSSAASIHPRYFEVFQDALYFVTANGTNYENNLYKTDGTAAGTVHIELTHNTDEIFPNGLAADADYLYMGAHNENLSIGAEVYRYDGIHTECALLEGETGVSTSSEPSDLFVHDGTLYFTANLPATGRELYTPGGAFTPGLSTSTTSAAALSCVLYPNPATERVTVTSSEQIRSLRLINAFGSVLRETTEASMDVSSYAAGVYYVEILFANNESVYEKLVLNK